MKSNIIEYRIKTIDLPTYTRVTECPIELQWHNMANK